MIAEFNKINNCENDNMTVLNFVIFKNYLKNKRSLIDLLSLSMMGKLLQWRYRIFRKLISRDLTKFNLPFPDQGIVNEEGIFSGSPFNSMFKKFENKRKSNAYMIHK